MKTSKYYTDIAALMRKTAANLELIREKRKTEKMEKCAATIVAKVGLEELKKKLTETRR